MKLFKLSRLIFMMMLFLSVSVFAMAHAKAYFGYSEQDLAYLKSIYTDKEMSVIAEKEIPRKVLFGYLKYRAFDLSDYDRYETLRLPYKLSYRETLNRFYHPYIMSGFYEHPHPAVNINTYLVLVNKNYQLSKDYIPKNLVLCDEVPLLVPGDLSRYYLEAPVCKALSALYKRAQKESLTFYFSSGYRSYEKQERIYQKYGKNADLYSAKPGHSEHQTGLALDLTSKTADYLLTGDFEHTPEGRFIAQNAKDFGFIIRYPKDKERLTGYLYEPWHLRYVGVKAANTITKEQLLLEEYLWKYTEMPK